MAMHMGGVDPDDLLGKAYDSRIAGRLVAFAAPYRARVFGAIVLLMFTTNWKLAILAFLVLPVMAIVMTYWRRRAVETYRATRRTIGVVNANLAESISGMRVVQSFTREPANMRHFDRLNSDNFDTNRAAAFL